MRPDLQDRRGRKEGGKQIRFYANIESVSFSTKRRTGHQIVSVHCWCWCPLRFCWMCKLGIRSIPRSPTYRLYYHRCALIGYWLLYNDRPRGFLIRGAFICHSSAAEAAEATAAMVELAVIAMNNKTDSSDIHRNQTSLQELFWAEWGIQSPGRRGWPITRRQFVTVSFRNSINLISPGNYLYNIVTTNCPTLQGINWRRIPPPQRTN